MQSKKTVCVMGLGYIGLPLALLLAKEGVTVVGFDVDQKKLATLNNGELPLKENGLPALFKAVRKKKNFQIGSTVPATDIYIIAVPTPQKDSHSDLSYVFSCLELIRPQFKANGLIILESTVGPSDCEKKIIPEIEKWGVPFKFAHCPERAVPGSTLREMAKNDRVIGGNTPQAALSAKKLYQTFVKGKIYLTTPNQAAAVKTMENTYRAVNIALANEFSKIAEELGLDIWEAIRLANCHPRVQIHQPGPGVGGHCIPVDPWFFVGESKNAVLIEQSLKLNEAMPSLIAKKVLKLIENHSIKKPTIGILGYTYKKNVDDTRETPVKLLITALQKKVAVLVHDPYVEKIDQVKTTTLEELLKKSNCIIVGTDHDAFTTIQFKNHKNIIFVYDTRNIFTDKNLRSAKATLYKLGSSHK